MSGYTSFDLRKYAETIQTLPLKGLSVSGLESLSRANLAIYHMLISDSLDDIYGNRKKYLARIKKDVCSLPQPLCTARFHHLVSDGEPDAEFSIGSGADNFPVAR